MNFFKKTKNNKKNGFIIMVAVLVSSMLISIGTFIAVIALKEIQLSSSSKDSQKAFYAADAAIECALFHDIRSGQSGGPFPRNLDDINGDLVTSIIECNGQPVKIYHAGNYNDDPPAPDDMAGITATPIDLLDTPPFYGSSVSYFEISFQRQGESLEVSPYARVRIYKYDIGGDTDETTIQAFGHNMKSGVRVVERSLEVTY